MKNEINVTVTEQPGEISAEKSRQLCALILQYYAAHKAEIDGSIQDGKEESA